MKKNLAAALVAVFSAFILAGGAHAQTAVPINAQLKEAATLIPVPGIKGAVTDMFSALKPIPSGGYMAKSNAAGLPLQLYVFGDADQQAILLVVDSTISMPPVFNNKAWKQLANARFSKPIFSLSTVDFSLDAKDMPAEFQQVLANGYFNASSIDFSSGFQVATKLYLGGIMKSVFETGLGVPAQDFTLRAGVVLPVPRDTAGRASLAANVLADLKNVDKIIKDAPEFQAEFQLAPGRRITGPIGMTALVLSDATLSLDNKLTLGYKGNIGVSTSNKKFITFFETPLTPGGVMDLGDFKFGMAAQSFTMTDYVDIMLAMATQAVQPEGFIITHIPKYKVAIDAVTKPLSVIQLRNPMPLPDYRFGDKTKPFPPLSSFNLLMLGPQASVDDGTGQTVKGPYFKAVSDAVILGQKLGTMNVVMSASGLHGKATAATVLKLGPLGKQTISMVVNADVNLAKQLVTMHGNVLGRILDVTLNGNTLSILSPATCATPFEITEHMEIKPELNLAMLLDGVPGVNVDPAKLQNCIGAELEKAYKWVASAGKDLGGYTAAAANAELKKISDAAAQAAKAAEEAAAAAAKATADAARAEYNRVKNAARDKANQASNDAMHALNDAGNAIKGIGVKKKHKGKPDARLDRSVFNWDYYYDNNQDVVKSGMDLVTHWRDYGYYEGRQGSPEFSAKDYLARYPDLRQNVGDFDGALWHWVNYGPAEGRQASPDFSVRAYLARYPDLQKAFGATNYDAAFDHWMDNGKAEGRNGRP